MCREAEISSTITDKNPKLFIENIKPIQTRMMKEKISGKKLLMYLLVLFNSHLYAQSVFMKSLSFNDSTGIVNNVDNIFETADSHYLIFEHRQTSFQIQGHIIKTDSLFNPVMSLKLEKQISSVTGPDLFTDIIQLPDSGYAVCVKIASTSNSKVGIIRLDKNGQVVSQKQISEAVIGLYPHKLALLNDSVMIIGCTYLGGPLQGRSGYLRTDFNGNLLSYNFRRIGTQNPDLVTPIVTSDNFILTSFINSIQFGPAYKSQIGMVKYNASGIVQWAKLFVDSSAAYESIEVKEMPDGNYLICGGRTLVNGSPVYNGFFLAVSQTGQILWSKYLSQADFSYNNIAIWNNDTIVLTGSQFQGQYQVITLIGPGGNVYGSYQFQPAALSSISSSMVTGNSKWISKTSGTNSSSKAYYLYQNDIRSMTICNGTPLSLTENTISFVDSSGSTAGTYSFAVTNTNFGFTMDTVFPVVINECSNTAIEEVSLVDILNVFPNPSVDFLNVEGFSNSKGDLEYMIIENTGRQVMKGKVNANKSTINVALLSKGIYTVKIISDNQISIKRFVKF